jgi:hypothetical protein
MTYVDHYEKYKDLEIDPDKYSYINYLRQQLTGWQFDTLMKIPDLNLEESGFDKIVNDFTNIEERVRREIRFLRENTNLRHDSNIMDVCLGSGATVIGLKQLGLPNVAANEIDPKMKALAGKNLESYEITIEIESYDWRTIHGHYPYFYDKLSQINKCVQGLYFGTKENFREVPHSASQKDIILCPGNSMTELFIKEHRIDSLRNFYNLLKLRGELVIDERNYPQIFADYFRGNFKNRGTGPYAGVDKVEAKPIYVSEGMIVMRYTHKISGVKAHLVLYPFKKGELESELRIAGFRNIRKFADYKRIDEGIKGWIQENLLYRNAEFYTYVAEK